MGIAALPEQPGIALVAMSEQSGVAVN